MKTASLGLYEYVTSKRINPSTPISNASKRYYSYVATIATMAMDYFLVERLKKVVLVLKVRTSATSIQAFVAMCVVIIEGRNIAMDLITLPFVQKLQMEVVHAQKVLRSVDKVSLQVIVLQRKLNFVSLMNIDVSFRLLIIRP